MYSTCKHRFVLRTGRKTGKGEKILQCRKCKCDVVERPKNGSYFIPYCFYFVSYVLITSNRKYDNFVTRLSGIWYWVVSIVAELIVPVAIAAFLYFVCFCPFVTYTADDEDHS